MTTSFRMHPCLALPEIITMICREVERDTQCTQSRKRLSGSESATHPLLSLALTSRTISSIALSILWEEQEGFIPLLSCFPKEMLHVMEPEEDQRVKRLRLRRDAQPADWRRVQFYSKFVRRLRLWTLEETFGLLDSEALIGLYLSLICLGSPLLPNLKNLHYHSNSVPRAAHPFLSIATGPFLDLIMYTAEGVALGQDVTLLRAVAQRSPLVTEFICNHATETAVPSIRTMDTLLDSFTQFPRLRYASVPYWPPLLEYMSTAPDLEGLVISSRRHCAGLESANSRSEHPSLSGPPYQFDNISTLSLDFETGQQYVDFLDHVTFIDSPLHTLHLYITQNPPMALQSTILEKMYAKMNIPSIRHLSVVMRFSSGSDQCFTVSDVIRSLLRARSLESLEFFIPEILVTKGYSVRIDDKFMEEVARGWRQLQNLTIAPYAEGDDSIQSSEATLLSLVTLADNCPDLAYLRFMVDATSETIPALEEVLPAGRTRTHHRSAIDLVFTNPSPIRKENVQGVAQFLTQVFGEVASLEVDETSPDREAWEEVGRLVMVQNEKNAMAW